MNKISLKIKLILIGIVILIIPVIILGYVSIKYTSNALLNMANERALQLAIEIADIVDTTIKQEVKLAYGLANCPTITNTIEKIVIKNNNDISNELITLDNFVKHLFSKIGNDYETIIVADKNGLIISDHLDSRSKNISIEERDYFIETSNGYSSIGSPVWSKLNGNPVCVIGAPIKNKHNDFIGMLGLVIRLDTIYEKISSVKIGNTGYPFMVDKNGVIITHPNKSHILRTNLSTMETVDNIIKQMVSQKKGTASYEFEGVEKIAGFAPVRSVGWSVGVTQEKKEFLEQVKIIKKTIIISIIIFLIVVIVGVLYFTNSVILPVNWIIDSLGNKSHTVKINAQQLFEKIIEISDKTSDYSKNILIYMHKLFKIMSVDSEMFNTKNDIKTLYDTIKDKSQYSEEEYNNIKSILDNFSEIINLFDKQATNMNNIYQILLDVSSYVDTYKNDMKEFSSLSNKMLDHSEEIAMNVNELIAVVKNNNGKIIF